MSTETWDIELAGPVVNLEERPKGKKGDKGDTGSPGSLPPGTHATRPASAVAGQTYAETDTGKVFRWSGSAWVEDTRLAASTTVVDPLGTGTADVQTAIVRAPMRRIHRRDGVASGWSRIPISQDTGDDPAAKPHTFAVTSDGRLRITADPTLTYANRRECRVLDGTDGWVNSEIRSIWHGPSVLTVIGGNIIRPQMGHVHRATSTGGAIVDQDQAATWDVTWCASWGWTGTSLTLGTAVAGSGNTRRPAMIRGVQRFAGTPASLYIAVDSAEGFVAGDLITVAGTGNAQVDADWTVDTVYSSYNSVFPTPMILVKDSVNTGAMAATPAQGWIRYRSVTGGDNPKAIYPFHVASRLIGTVLSAKKWRVGTQEPPWGTYQLRSGCSWEVDLAASTPALPASGKCGVIDNHLWGYGPRTVTDGVTTSGSKTITSATAAFGYQDTLGGPATITGAGIPAGTTITPVNATTATLSVAATASATGVSFTIGTATGAYMEYSDIEIRQL